MLLDWWERQKNSLNFIPVLYTKNQTQGIGQKNRTWYSDNGSLTFSVILPVHEIISLTPLEISLLIRNFISTSHNIELQLKWPNDLVDTQNKKYGGILCHSRNHHVVIGIGLNLYPAQENLISHLNAGYLFSNPSFNPQDFLNSLLIYLQTNRYQNSELVRDNWMKHCNHRNKQVSLDDEGKKIKGQFLGIGQFGEALIQSEFQKIQTVTNGSLTIDQPSNSN